MNKEFVSDKIKVCETPKGKGIFAKDVFKKDEIILQFKKNFVKSSTNHTFRISNNLHQENPDFKAPENLINHSCEPNGYINFQDLTFKALHKIKAGEELTYNYFTTDLDDEDVFLCKCVSKKCLKKIAGFKSLPLKEKKKLLPLLSPFLRKRLEKEISSKK